MSTAPLSIDSMWPLATRSADHMAEEINEGYNIVIIPRSKGVASTTTTRMTQHQNCVIRMDLLDLLPKPGVFCTLGAVSGTMAQQYVAPRPMSCSSATTSNPPSSFIDVTKDDNFILPKMSKYSAADDTTTQLAKLNECMFKTEVTRQWINENIKARGSGVVCHGPSKYNKSNKKKESRRRGGLKKGCRAVKANTRTSTTTHHTAGSSSKRYFRLRSKLTKLRKQHQQQQRQTRISNQISSAEAPNGIKTFQDSGVVQRAGRKTSVSDFLRQTQRPLY